MLAALALQTAVSPLFVPATRPERFAKAVTSGADAIILDLEDAVAAADKSTARDGLAAIEGRTVPLIVRINGLGTPWHDEDVAAVVRSPVDAIMLPKAQGPADIASLVGKLKHAIPVIALVETAVGVANAASIAGADGVARLAFGSVDYCADLGCDDQWDSLLHARSAITLASRVAGIPAPLDGVSLSLDDAELVRKEAKHASRLGFSGKLCIHPHQVAPVQQGFAPSESDIAWARRILLSASGGAVRIDGIMVDPPVLRRAQRIVERAMSADGAHRR